MSDQTVNQTKIFWCIVYLIIGILLLGVALVPKISILLQILITHLTLILWCIGCAAIGIALGLYNGRKSGIRDRAHYVTYFFFVLFFATTAALTASFIGKGLQSYSSSCLTAIGIGFAGDSLAGIINKIGKL